MLKFFAEKMWVAFALQKLLTFFQQKNIIILYIESAKTVNEMTLNELVKLTTLWTTGPKCIKTFLNLNRSWLYSDKDTHERFALDSCSYWCSSLGTGIQGKRSRSFARFDAADISKSNLCSVISLRVKLIYMQSTSLAPESNMYSYSTKYDALKSFWFGWPGLHSDLRVFGNVCSELFRIFWTVIVHRLIRPQIRE